MYRNSSYEEYQAKQFKDPEYVKEFILAQIEGQDSVPLEEAIIFTIKCMGVAEFCVLAKMRKQNVNDFLKGRRKLKPETMDAFLKPFGLKTKVIAEKAS